jgi:hypothetical protein
MKKFIITEEEKNRILGMHQDYGYSSLNEQDYGTDAKKNVEILKQQSFHVLHQLQFHMITTQKKVILWEIMHQQKWTFLECLKTTQL